MGILLVNQFFIPMACHGGGGGGGIPELLGAKQLFLP